MRSQDLDSLDLDDDLKAATFAQGLLYLCIV